MLYILVLVAVVCKSQTYVSNGNVLSWDAARQSCADLGSNYQLATFDNQAQVDTIEALCNINNPPEGVCYLGFSNMNFDSTIEFIDGETFVASDYPSSEGLLGLFDSTFPCGGFRNGDSSLSPVVCSWSSGIGVICENTGLSNVGGGDPEYTTLDGLSYNYDGPCQYKLISNDCNNYNDNNNDKFSIITRHGRARSRQKQIHIIQSIIININNQHIISLFKNNTVKSNLGKKLLFDSSNKLFYKNLDILLLKELNKNNKLESRIIVKYKNKFTLKVSLDNNGIVWLDVNKQINTCGILGNNNQNKSDDLMLPNGRILYDINQKNIDIMCDSWLVPYQNQPLQCTLYPEDSQSKSSYCKNFDYEDIKNHCDEFVQKQLNIIGGKYVSKCFSFYDIDGIDATRIYDDCITEICNCDDNTLELCKPKYSLNNLINACKNNNITINL